MPRIALVQIGSCRDAARNVEKAAGLAFEAAESGANIICFPEVCNTVYPAWENNPEHFEFADPIDGRAVTHMREVARETGTVIIYPIFERTADGEFFNTATVLGTKGELLGRYRKSSVPTSRLFPDGSEDFYFKPGDTPFPVFDTPFGVKIGVIICYDRNLPEPARCIGLNGADVMFVPVATIAAVRSRWEVLLRAHAIMNIFYVAAVNKVGPEEGGAPGALYMGNSLIIDPEGEIIARGSEQEEQIVLSDLDLKLLSAQRAKWHYYEDRRPDLYGVMTKRPQLRGVTVAAEGLS